MLTKFQMALYWREWAKVRAAIEEARGELIKSVEADEIRHACHALAGAPTSSKRLSNASFDLVLASFFSISHAAKLDPQLRQMDQPVTRCRWVVNDLCAHVQAALVLQDRPEDAGKVAEGERRDGYVKALLVRASGGRHLDHPGDYPATTWIKVIHMMSLRLAQVRGQGGEGETVQPAPRRLPAKAKRSTPAAQPVEFDYSAPVKRTRAVPVATSDDPF